MSQVQLAASAGVSVGVIYRIERGESVTTGRLKAVIDALQRAGGVSSADKDAAGLLRSLEALVRQRYGLDEIGAITYVVDMPNRIRALEAELAALRTRAVPAIVWPDDPREPAKAGCFELLVARICNEDRDWHWYVYPGEDLEEIEGGEADSLEDARRDCEAAFLRLVGCGS